MKPPGSFTVVLSHRAIRFFERADAPLQRRLDRCFDQLKLNPRRHSNIKVLSGDYAGFFRYRVGDYRVVYAVNDPAQTVEIILIAHRREVYE